MKPARILVDADEFPPLRSTVSHEQHQNPVGLAFLRKQMQGSGRAPVARMLPDSSRVQSSQGRLIHRACKAAKADVHQAVDAA